jgi:hypothetical protein
MQDELEIGLINFGKKITRGSVISDAIITSIDEDKFTVDVTIDGLAIPNIPIKVLSGSQASFIEIPKVQSKCLICFRDNNHGRPQLFKVHEVDKILIKIGNTTIQIDKDGYKLENGSSGLKNTFKNLINELIQFKTVSPGGNGVTDPGTITNLQKYLQDLDKYLTD